MRYTDMNIENQSSVKCKIYKVLKNSYENSIFLRIVIKYLFKKLAFMCILLSYC